MNTKFVACVKWVRGDADAIYPCKPIISVQQQCEFYVRNTDSYESAYCKFKYIGCTNADAIREADVQQRLEDI